MNLSEAIGGFRQERNVGDAHHQSLRYDRISGSDNNQNYTSIDKQSKASGFNLFSNSETEQFEKAHSPIKGQNGGRLGAIGIRSERDNQNGQRHLRNIQENIVEEESQVDQAESRRPPFNR